MGLRKTNMSREISHLSDIDNATKLIDKICLICSEFANAGYPEPNISLGEYCIDFDSEKFETKEEYKNRLEKEIKESERNLENNKQRLDIFKKELEELR